MAFTEVGHVGDAEDESRVEIRLRVNKIENDERDMGWHEDWVLHAAGAGEQACRSM